MTARRASRRRISPGVVFLVVALVASIAFVAYAVTVREADQIPLLAAGSVVLGLAFGALAVSCLRSVWLARHGDRAARTLLVGLVGGGAAIATAGCFAAAMILFQLSAGPG